jgi:hypothetical protein
MMRKDLVELVEDENYYTINTKYVYNKKIIKNILGDSFKSQTGIYLPDDIFSLIWNQIDFSFSEYDLSDDIVTYIDNLYFDIVHKSSYKYKRNGKITNRLKKMYKYMII